MPNQVQSVRQAASSLMACGLITSLLSSFAATLSGQTVDPESVLGDTTMPSPEDVSQNFPYGITGKTPPSLIKINYEGQAADILLFRKQDGSFISTTTDDSRLTQLADRLAPKPLKSSASRPNHQLEGVAPRRS